MVTMSRVRVDPMEYPLEKGESWWIVHPNTRAAEFRVPTGAITACLDGFLEFYVGKVYNVVSCDNHNGWVTLICGTTIYDMPQYLFARKFDAEAFVVGIATSEELENAKKWNYQRTIPTNFKG